MQMKRKYIGLKIDPRGDVKCMNVPTVSDEQINFKIYSAFYNQNGGIVNESKISPTLHVMHLLNKWIVDSFVILML